MQGYTFSRQKSAKIRILLANMQDMKKVLTPINTHSQKQRHVYVFPIYSYDDRKTYLIVESPDAFMTALASAYKQFKEKLFTEDLVVVSAYSSFLNQFEGFHITTVQRRESIAVDLNISESDMHRIIAETLELREQEKAQRLRVPTTEGDFDFSEWDCTHS